MVKVSAKAKAHSSVKDRKNSAQEFEQIMNPQSTSTNQVVSNSSIGSTIKKLDVEIDTSKYKLQTKNPVFQQVEIEALQESLKLQAEIQNEITKTRGEMKTKHIKYSEKFLNTDLCNILDIVGDDVVSFDDLIKRLEVLAQSVNHQNSCTPCKPEGQEVENNSFKKPPLPPSITATNNGTYSSTNSSSSNKINETVESLASTTSSNKVPRVYQPGEILYSKNFSPLLIPPKPIEEDEIKTPVGRKERLQVADGKNKIEIDVVLKAGKGGKVEQKLFNEFMIGVKQIRTAKTTVTQKRVMLPRVPQKPKETKNFAESSESSAISSASSSQSQEKDKKLKKEKTPTPAKRTRFIGNKFKKQGEWAI